jgi:hypothetical protein
VSSAISDFIDQALSGPISGTKYQSIRQDLNKKIQTLRMSSPQQAEMLRSLKSVLDGAFNKAAGPEVAAVKKVIDQEYGRFATIRDVFERNGGEQATQGMMPLASLAREATKRGRFDKEFEQLARAGSAVLGSAGANSGTPSRLMNAGMFGGLLSGAWLANPVLAGASVGVPFGASQMLSRGVTGQGAVNALPQIGRIGSRVIVPADKAVNP